MICWLLFSFISFRISLSAAVTSHTPEYPHQILERGQIKEFRLFLQSSESLYMRTRIWNVGSIVLLHTTTDIAFSFFVPEISVQFYMGFNHKTDGKSNALKHQSNLNGGLGTLIGCQLAMEPQIRCTRNCIDLLVFMFIYVTYSSIQCHLFYGFKYYFEINNVSRVPMRSDI